VFFSTADPVNLNRPRALSDTPEDSVKLINVNREPEPT